MKTYKYRYEHDNQTRVGNGEWYDAQWRHLSLGDHPSSPDPPLSMSKAQEYDRWNEALSAGVSVVQP